MRPMFDCKLVPNEGGVNLFLVLIALREAIRLVSSPEIFFNSPVASPLFFVLVFRFYYLLLSNYSGHA